MANRTPKPTPKGSSALSGTSVVGETLSRITDDSTDVEGQGRGGELPSLSKPNTLEAFLKARTDLRVGVDAINALLTALDQLGTQIAQAATKSAKAEKRTTILEKDITVALAALLGGSDLDGIFKRLESLNSKDTAQLAKQIEQWLKEH